MSFLLTLMAFFELLIASVRFDRLQREKAGVVRKKRLIKIIVKIVWFMVAVIVKIIYAFKL